MGNKFGSYYLTLLFEETIKLANSTLRGSWTKCYLYTALRFLCLFPSLFSKNEQIPYEQLCLLFKKKNPYSLLSLAQQDFSSVFCAVVWHLLTYDANMLCIRAESWASTCTLTHWWIVPADIKNVEPIRI